MLLPKIIPFVDTLPIFYLDFSAYARVCTEKDEQIHPLVSFDNPQLTKTTVSISSATFFHLQMITSYLADFSAIELPPAQPEVIRDLIQYVVTQGTTFLENDDEARAPAQPEHLPPRLVDILTEASLSDLLITFIFFDYFCFFSLNAVSQDSKMASALLDAATPLLDKMHTRLKGFNETAHLHLSSDFSFASPPLPDLALEDHSPLAWFLSELSGHPCLIFLAQGGQTPRHDLARKIAPPFSSPRLDSFLYALEWLSFIAPSRLDPFWHIERRLLDIPTDREYQETLMGFFKQFESFPTLSPEQNLKLAKRFVTWCAAIQDPSLKQATLRELLETFHPLLAPLDMSGSLKGYQQFIRYIRAKFDPEFLSEFLPPDRQNLFLTTTDRSKRRRYTLNHRAHMGN